MWFKPARFQIEFHEVINGGFSACNVSGKGQVSESTEGNTDILITILICR
jgi:hypothetical protein